MSERYGSPDYTPTTEQVRQAWEHWSHGCGDEFDRWLARVEAGALREFADELCGVPDYTATRYDQGRADQRHYVAVELYERANKIEKEAGL